MGVEGKFLGISFAGGVTLYPASIQLTAENSATVGLMVNLSLFRLDVVSLVPERLVDSSIRAKRYPAQIVSPLSHVDLKARGHDLACFRESVPVSITIAEEIGFGGHKDI